MHKNDTILQSIGIDGDTDEIIKFDVMTLVRVRFRVILRDGSTFFLFSFFFVNSLIDESTVMRLAD